MNILPGEYFKRYEMKFDITVNDPLLEPFLPVIRRRHERSVLKELEFTNRKKRLADIFNNHLCYLQFFINISHTQLLFEHPAAPDFSLFQRPECIIMETFFFRFILLYIIRINKVQHDKNRKLRRDHISVIQMPK